MIVDAHAHIFSRISGRIRQGTVEPAGFGRVKIGAGDTILVLPPIARDTTFPPDALVECMNWAGIDKAVLLQGPFYGERNQEVSDAVREWPGRFTGAAYVDPWDPDAESVLDRAVQEQGLRIVKLELSETTGLAGLHPGLHLDDETAAWLWSTCEQRSVVVVLDLGAIGSASYQTAAVARIVAEHPELKIVIPHLAQPTPKAEKDPAQWRLWEEQICLGKHGGVWFDLAALPHRASPERFPYPSIRRWLQRATDLIGSHKLLWGTDVPAVLTAVTYPQLRELADEHLSFLPAADRRAVLGETALSVYPFGAAETTSA